MHPILFRIPLPGFPLKLWWALAAVAVIALVYAALSFRRGEKRLALGIVVAAAALGGVGWKFKDVSYQAANLPIYSYGVMLGISLVIGWYLTLTLCERDGLPKETMANCYVITALAAIAGSRILYVVTNISEFEHPETHDFQWAWIFALRKGGLVAYGGFLGGFLGSWLYLRTKKINLMPWADDAVPSLASGLLVTRIGCYLFGCDFGTRLPAGAPAFLKKLGTFPHWAQGTLDAGDGLPAYVRHLELFHGSPLELEITKANASLPVHPTQIYESLVGLLLLALLLWQRKNVKFRGQLFFLFVFGYGFCRFLLEIIRDDTERGSYGPMLEAHILVPGALLLFSLGFVFGISLGIKNQTARMVARVVAFLPPIVTFVMLKPASFAKGSFLQLSTSQWIGLATALLAAYFYANFWQNARKNPTMAMSLGEGAVVETAKAKQEEEEDEEEEDEEAAEEDEAVVEEKSADEEGPKKTKKKGLVVKKKPAAKIEDEEDKEEVAAKGDPSPAT